MDVDEEQMEQRILNINLFYLNKSDISAHNMDHLTEVVKNVAKKKLKKVDR